MMYEVMIESMFSAAHHLLNYEGKCENPHGHNFVVRVWARKATLDVANVSIDYKVLKASLREIMNDLDHTDLNENPCINGESPSSEYLCKYIYHRMKQTIPEIYKTCVYETPTQCCFYWED
ncbi:MAG: 6-pyruvoyl trahydropterin synthase family protein [Vampirovibrionales bacterium]